MRLKGKIIASPFTGDKDRIGKTILMDVSYNNTDFTQSIEEVVETEEGKLWATSLGAGGEAYVTQINFCPLTGKPAKVKRDDFDHSKAWLNIAEAAYEQKLNDIEKRANEAYDAEPPSNAKYRRGPPGKIGRANIEYDRSIIEHNAKVIEDATAIGRLGVL